MKIARVCYIYCRKRWMKILFMRPDIPKKRVKFVTCAFDTLRGWAAKLEEVVYEKTWGKVMCIWKSSALHVLEEAANENMGGKVIFKTTLWMRCMYWRKRLLKIWVGKSYSKPHSGCTAWIGGSGFWNNGWKMGGKVMFIWKGTLKIGWRGYWKYGGESHVHFKATLYELEEAPIEKKGGKVIHG